MYIEDKILIGKNVKTKKNYYLTLLHWALSVHLLGSPGRGKSKLIELICQELLLNRQGFIFIDPHGSTVKEVLRSIRTNRLYRRRRIHVIDPTSGWAFQFNPLFHRSEQEREEVVSNVVQTIAHVFGSENTDKTPLLERMLTLCLYALASNGLTLSELPLVTSTHNVEVRERLTSSIDNWYYREAWRELNTASKREFREHLDSLHNRSNRFLGDRVARSMLGQKGTLDIRKAMDDGDIILVNLALGSRESARMIGSLLLDAVFRAAQSRPAGSKTFSIIVDEAHLLLNPGIETALFELRKRGTPIVLSHQGLQQLRKAGEGVFEAVMGGAQCKIVMGNENMHDVDEMVYQMYSRLDLEEPKMSLPSWQVVGHTLVEIPDSSVTVGEGETIGESTAYTEGEGTVEGRASISSMGQVEQISHDELTKIMFSQAEVYSDLRSRNSSVTQGSNHQKNRSRSRTTSRTLHPILEEVYNQTYSLEEQRYRKSSLINNLPVAHALVKVPSEEPVLIKIPFVDSGHVRDRRVEELRMELCESSPYTRLLHKVDDEIQERHLRLKSGSPELPEYDDDYLG